MLDILPPFYATVSTATTKKRCWAALLRFNFPLWLVAQDVCAQRACAHTTMTRPAGPVSIKARQRMSPALNIYWSHTEIAGSLTISHAPSGRRGLNHFIIVSKTKRTLSERSRKDAHGKIDPYWTGNIQGSRACKNSNNHNNYSWR